MTQVEKQIFLIGNWKSHKTLEEAQSFMSSIVLPPLPAHVHVVICPPFPYLFELKTTMELGVQDLSPFPYGAYTGAVTGAMVCATAKYAILGHSERRKYFHETNQEVAQKAREALANNLTPIVCIDEPYLEAQLAFFTTEELKQMIIAYEPLSSIGSGTPDTPEHAQQMAERAQQCAQCPVSFLYGGSVTPQTVKSFVDQPGINGVLVGGASLEAESWSALVNAAI